MKSAGPECILNRILFLVTKENLIHILLCHVWRDKADNQDDGETTNHSDSTAVDGVDRIAQQHVDNRQTYAPEEAGPFAGGGDTTPVETKHEG